MNLLVISYYLPPLLNPQSFQVGRLLYYLPQQYRVHGVTIEDSAIQKDDHLYPDLFDKFEGFLRIKTSRATFAGRFRLPGNSIRWHLRAYLKIVRAWKNNEFDRIVTFAAPMSSNVMGLWLKRKYRKPWIAFFSDPWADNAYTSSGSIKKRIVCYFERAVMDKADTLVFTCPEAHEFYVKKYPFIRGKSTYLEHSYDQRCFKTADRVQTKMLTMRHIGSLYGDRDPSTLLRALRRMQNISTKKADILVEVIGHVDVKYAKLLSETEQDGYSSVTTRSTVTYTESLRLMQEADVLLAIDMLCDNNIFLMSKLIDYVGSGRPILALASKNSATARVVGNLGGWFVEPNDDGGMVTALQAICDNYRSGTLSQFAPKNDIKKEYSIDCHIKKFIQILEDNSDSCNVPRQRTRIV